jgi:hypothetical protein
MWFWICPECGNRNCGDSTEEEQHCFWCKHIRKVSKKIRKHK